MLRAWRAYERYDPDRALDSHVAVSHRHERLPQRPRGPGRRPLPSGVGQPFEDPEAAFVARPKCPGSSPFRIACWASVPEDPAVRALERSGLRLALVAALQVLPAKQRAVLILRDVLGFSAAEVADLLDTSTAAVTSALQRARVTFAGPGLDVELVHEPERGAASGRRPVRGCLRARRCRQHRPVAGRRGGAGDAADVELVRRARRLRPVHGPGIRHAGSGLAHGANLGQQAARHGRLRPSRRSLRACTPSRSSPSRRAPSLGRPCTRIPRCSPSSSCRKFLQRQAMSSEHPTGRYL